MAVDRQPPHNIEAEQSTLGSLIIDPEAYIRVAEFLKADDFYREAHRSIYAAISDLNERHEPADLITLCDELERRSVLAEVGGPSYVTTLVNLVPTSIHVEHYGRIVERTATMRRLIAAAGQIATLGYEDNEDTEATLDRAEQILFAISQRRLAGDFVPLRTLLHDYLDRIDYVHQHRGEVAGVPTGFADLDRLTGGLQPSDLIIIGARPSMGKCLSARMLVDDPATGERLSIEECVRRRITSVYGVSEQGTLRPTPVTDWIDSGIKPCFRVTTRTGRSVEVTGHHPFRTVRGWEPLHDLIVGNRIAVPTALPTFGTDGSWPMALVRLLAYFIAEGGLTTTCPKFTNTDPIIIDDFHQIIADHFPTCSIRQERITYVVSQSRVDYRRLNPLVNAIMPLNPVTIWLTNLGLMGKLSKEKAFPTCVWQWSRQHLAVFLRVLLSCDGTIYSLAGRPRIEFCVASEPLAADVHHALLRFGVIAKLYTTKYGAWRVEITAPGAVQRYQEEIGWIGAKAQRFSEFTASVPLRLSNVGQAPRETWQLVQAARVRHGLSMVEVARRAGETIGVGKNAGYNPHMRRGIPHPRLRRYAEVLSDKQLHIISSADVYWDEIMTIEPVGEQQVYDLTVPDGENFVAEDIFVHNTALCVSLAHASAMKHGTVVGMFALEMSAEQIVQRFMSIEAAVDQQRLRTGYIDDQEWDRIIAAAGALSEAPIYIDDTPGITTLEVRAKARRLAAQVPLGLIIIDYLQLMQGRGRGDGNRVQEISEISRSLKGLARELDVPVIALAQLSRGVESRQDHHPMLSDLRESGCLPGNTLIFLPDTGMYQRLDGLVGHSDFNVLSLNTESWRLERRAVLRAFSTGRKPVFRLQTRLGRTIRATANHQFLTINGWQSLEKLTTGTRLALPRRLCGANEKSMPDAEVALLAHLIGDGCTLARQPIHYTTTDRDLAELVALLAVTAFGSEVKPRISQERRWFQVYLAATAHLTHGVRNPVAKWLDGLGVFSLRSYEKSIPQVVFAQPDESIARFLRHLWATDGAIWDPRASKHAPGVYYASSSKELAWGVQSLLLRLGINANLSRWPQQGNGRDQYHVEVSGGDDLQRFVTEVGAVGERKSRALVGIQTYLSARSATTNRDVIPRDVWRSTVVPAMLLAGITSRKMQMGLGNAYCGTTLYKQNIGRTRAARLADVVGSERLASLSRSDVYWDEVTSIEAAGEEDVYDLTVDGLHNFVADNFVVHNSIEQDADIVMFIYRDEVYNPSTDRHGIADIIVAKHRNGPVGQVSLRWLEQTARFVDLELYHQPTND